MNAQAHDMPALTGQILLDVPAAEYHRRELGVASNTVLKLLREKSPAHYRHWVDAEDDSETPALAFGRAYHCRVLEPERFASEYVVAPDFGDMRSSTNRAKRDAWLAGRPGVTLLSADTSAQIEAMHAALMAHPVAAGIMRQGVSEVTMRWTDPETGVRVKARADWWVRGKFFMDLKTTEDASPEGFARSVAKYGYHAQHALYCEGARECGEAITNYLIVAQEKAAPYVPAIYHIDTAAEARGYEMVRQGLLTMAECLTANSWPGYGAGIKELSLPPWALKEGAA